MSKILFCENCSQQIKDEKKPCPVCGCSKFTNKLVLSDRMSISERIQGKAKRLERKKPVQEFIYGVDYSKRAKKYMDKERLIDRENDIYHEKITDKETGQVIHECDEKLSEHFGHGSAKNKKEKN